MFFIRDKKEENNPHIPYIDYEEFRFNSGITPATRNIRKRKFRKPFSEEHVKNF
jgi:TATA-binding protein-associated factor Taf7